MKTFTILITSLVFLVNITSGQVIDYNRIILPENTSPNNIREKLVQLAWQNMPENKVLQNNKLIADQNIAAVSSEWLSLLRINFNINADNRNQQELNANAFYPRWNIGFLFPLGRVFEIPKRTKIARLEAENQVYNINSQKLFVRTEVLKRYYIFIQNLERFKIASQNSDGVYSNFLIAEEQFKNGEIDLNEYNEALNEYNDSLLNKINEKTQYEISKLNLEEMIGVPLEEVMDIG